MALFVREAMFLLQRAHFSVYASQRSSKRAFKGNQVMEAEIEYPVSRLDTEKDSALLGNRLHI